MKIALGVMVLAAASACALAQDASNPVVASAKEIFERQSSYIVAAAEQMPADNYGYHPTPDQWTYGKIVSHVIQANFGVCGMLSGDGPGTGPAATDTTPKDQLVPILKQSFDTCQKALDGLQDSSLGATITFFRGAKKPRARALVELTNGMLPPSAKK
jgi:hypothetical protein